MTAIAQPKNLGDLLKYEAPNLYSRDQDTVAAAQNLPLGTVVEFIDGRELYVGVLGNDVDATLIDREDAILIARHAIVARGALVWPTGISAAHKAAAIEQLEARGILARDSA